MFKVLRIIVLLLILATVAQTAWLARSRATAWENTLIVGIYPIAADDAANTKNYLGTLKPDTFRSIAEADTPRSLAYTLVGPATAREIGWLRK